MLNTTEQEVVRVLKERGPTHREDLGHNRNESMGVHGEWVGDGEIRVALQNLRKKGVVRAERDGHYRYWNWMLVA